MTAFRSKSMVGYACRQLPFLEHWWPRNHRGTMDRENERVKANVWYSFAQSKKQLKHDDKVSRGRMLLMFVLKHYHHHAFEPTWHCHQLKFLCRTIPLSFLILLRLGVKLESCLVYDDRAIFSRWFEFCKLYYAHFQVTCSRLARHISFVLSI